MSDRNSCLCGYGSHGSNYRIKIYEKKICPDKKFFLDFLWGICYSIPVREKTKQSSTLTLAQEASWVNIAQVPQAECVWV